MSATTAAANHRRTKVDPIGLRVWFWTSSLIVVGTLLSQGDDLWVSLRGDIGYILLWTIAMAFADYLEVRFWRGVHLTMSLTVGIAAAMVFDPVVAASIAFVGSLDPREVRGEMPLRRALYNRSQVAAAVGLSSVVFHQFQIPVVDWPMVLAPAAIAIVVDGLVNTAAVVVPICVFQKSSPSCRDSGGVPGCPSSLCPGLPWTRLVRRAPRNSDRSGWRLGASRVSRAASAGPAHLPTG